MRSAPHIAIDRGCRDISLSEALADPLIRAVMAADGVDPARLMTELAEAARRLGDAAK